MRITLLLLLILASITVKSQSSYSGNLGKHPIQLIMYDNSNGDYLAYYVYDKFDTPITINGNLKNGELNLFEKDSAENNFATLTFNDFNENNKTIEGKWVSADKSKNYQISLNKDFDIDSGDNVEWKSKELIQSNSTKEHYFKTIITKEKENYYARITGVKIFQKMTDKLIQTIKLDCQLFGIDNLSIGDYNFDGLKDFSVFESSYAGANTSSIYILRNSESEKYKVSSFSGSSLEFDNESKLINEHNQCCADKILTTKTYKVINNEMVFIEQKCLEYNVQKEDYIETECE
jgi:hypothetical protein